MLEQRCAIGVDVGGTSVKYGLLVESGAALSEGSFDVQEGLRGDDFLDQLAEVVRGLTPTGVGHGWAGVGLGVPGLLDRARGVVLESPNLPLLDGMALRDGLQRRLDVPHESIRIENDANVAALGEQWLGAARDQRNVLVVTLGTGVGGGLILDGQLFIGEGLAGEIGHLTIDPMGPPCGCGSRGCLETLASASAARRRAIAAGLPHDSPGNLKLLAERARAAAGPERELLHAVGHDLGRGLAAVICLLDLRSFVIGGGFSAALDVLETGIRTALDEWAYGDRVGAISVERAALGPRAGWIGAAHLLLAP